MYKVATSRSVEEVCKALAEVVPAHKFGILHVHDIRGTLEGKGVAMDRACQMYEM